MDVCPALAIYRNKETGAVLIDENLCIGCKMCLMACPLGAPWVDSESSRVMKCDLCSGTPQCVQYCGFGALQFVTAEEAMLKMRNEGARKISEVINRLSS
jgi:Fe-S-cluster-containing dehydrogenase component